MHDKPWVLLEQLQKIYEFYQQLFGNRALEAFEETVVVNLPDENY